jgi:hypothetical protein
LAAAAPAVGELAVAAIPIQWLKASLLIGVPPTWTTASPGIPPQAETPTRANKTAHSAAMKRGVVDIDGGTLAET